MTRLSPNSPKFLLATFVFSASLFSVSTTAWALETTLSASDPFPPLGTAVRLSASATDSDDGGEIWFRYRVRPPGGDYRIIRDFSPETELDFTTWQREGTYEIELTARNVASGETATNIVLIDAASRVQGGAAAVNATSHPLVFLYSAPACQTGDHMRVLFQGPDGILHQTPAKSCDASASMNFYLAGLYAQTEYRAWHVIEGASPATADGLSFITGEVDADLYPASVVQPAPPGASNQILLGNGNGAPTATDLDGNVLWYVTGIASLTRAENDGYFWTIVDGGGDPSRNLIRKFDLTGATVLETNTARVNEQLRALGLREISGFHHEAVTLPDGRIAALGGVEQMLTDVQGPGAVNILGDMIVVLDADLQVVWTWDTFDHLDVERPAVLGETCNRATSGCAPFRLAPEANDWTHGNSIQPTADGNLLYSTRHQDWLVKVNYSNGGGDGNVLWRLGPEGDFQILSDDPFPWFTHQHDGNFDPSDPTSLLVFDNGNTRLKNFDGSGHSRGQVLRLNEEHRTASLTLNADLGVASPAVGSAQKLANGNYHFDAGFVNGPGGLRAYQIEVDPSGAIVYTAVINNLSYRSFRMIDMYTPK